MNTVILKLSEVKPNPDNPRVIKDASFKKLVQSIKDFPEMLDARPLVLNKDKMILGGNMRHKAAAEAGRKEVPVVIVDWSLEKQREFIIKDNVSGGEWDWDNLANEWDAEELDNWGLELPVGFGDEETEQDEEPEVDESVPANSQQGGVYMLGRHKLMCGDSTSEEDVAKLLGEAKIDLLLTDPPYNVDYTGKTKDALKIQNDKKDDVEFQAFLTDAFLRANEYLKNGAAYYIFHADSEGFNFRAAVKAVGWELKQCLIWSKNSMVMGRQDYHWQHEPILYGWKSGSAHSWYSDRKQTTVLNFDRPTSSKEHPTTKPINILAYLIGNSSKAGDVVYDAFAGSGSTLVACEQTDRAFVGMELDPKYCDVIRKRYHKLTTGSYEGWEDATSN